LDLNSGLWGLKLALRANFRILMSGIEDNDVFL